MRKTRGIKNLKGAQILDKIVSTNRRQIKVIVTLNGQHISFNRDIDDVLFEDTVIVQKNDKFIIEQDYML